MHSGSTSFSTTSARPVSLLAWVISFAMASGCATVKTNKTTHDTHLRTYTSDVDPEWSYAAEVEVVGVANGVSDLALTVTRFHRCTEHRVIDRVIKTERTEEKPTLAVSTTVGLIGAALLGTGLGLHYGANKPLFETKMTDTGESDKSATTSGYLVILGGIMSLALPAAIIDGVRLMDTTDHVGEIDQRKPTICGETEPAAGVQVALRTDSGVLAEGASDGDGLIGLTIEDDQFPMADVPIWATVDGERARMPDIHSMVAEQQEEYQARRRADRQVAERARRHRELDQTLTQEAQSGQCSPGHRRTLEEYAVHHVPVVERAMGHDGPVDIHAHKIFAAAAEPEVYTIRASLGGLYHVFVVALDKVEITKAVGPDGDPVTVGSRYQIEGLFQSPHLDSRVARLQPFQTISVAVKGRGCALLVALNQVGQ